MIDWIIAKVGSMYVGKQLLSGVVWANAKATGKRTEIIVALELMLWVLRKLNILPPELSGAISGLSAGLLAAIPATLADKIKRGEALADKIVPEVPPKA